jgi:hypothetical protein
MNGAGKLPQPSRSRFPKQLLIRAFYWHARVFLVANAALNIINLFIGRSWWAFWPLVLTSFALAAHYLVYKSLSVDARWVEERAEELNLKSYDRSHIEDLKSRYGDPHQGDRQIR